VGLLITAYIGANAYFFTHAFLSYRAEGANLFIQIARGGGACLNFNGMLILIPMMRTLLTWIRKTFLFIFIPVDQNVEIHKLIGRVMFFFALIHTGAHLGNYYFSGASLTQNLFHTRVGITGVITMGAFIIIWLFSMEFIRKSRSHRLFSMTHLLYMAWFPAAMIHVRSFVMWTFIPVTGLVIELLIRNFVKTRQTFIDECQTHDTGVTHLILHRPDKFSFKAGEYLFLRIPRISHFGWHPFTISSAPEKQNQLEVHVRALGTWTKRLYNEMDKTPKEKRRLPAQIHGPYGAPATRIFNSKYAVLIGAGIGVTPFASILESIIMCREQNIKMNLEKVYFYWVYRDQETFQWFARLLNRIEEKNHRMLDINIYMTNARIDPLTGLLKIGMDIRRKEMHEDALTGLQSKTNFGRPDWNRIFETISDRHKLKRVNVFYCGPYPLGSTIRQAAHHKGFHFRMENF